MTTELIDKLTPKQTRLLAEWHARWFAVGSSCEPASAWGALCPHCAGSSTGGNEP